MQTIQELRRLPAPFPRPQGLAWDGEKLWLSSMTTKQICPMETSSWLPGWTTDAPGVPFGITSTGPELRVLCGETGEDNRIIRRCLPDKGFDPDFGIPCPDDTGSQLGFDGKDLYVSQWYNKRVLRLNASGGVEDTYVSPHEICGQVITGDSLYLMGTDDESTTVFLVTRIHLSTHETADLGEVPFQARSLAFDGTHFWTNHREAHETVSFTIPGI